MTVTGSKVAYEVAVRAYKLCIAAEPHDARPRTEANVLSIHPCPTHVREAERQLAEAAEP